MDLRPWSNPTLGIYRLLSHWSVGPNIEGKSVRSIPPLVNFTENRGGSGRNAAVDTGSGAPGTNPGAATFTPEVNAASGTLVSQRSHRNRSTPRLLLSRTSSYAERSAHRTSFWTPRPRLSLSHDFHYRRALYDPSGRSSEVWSRTMVRSSRTFKTRALNNETS